MKQRKRETKREERTAAERTSGPKVKTRLRAGITAADDWETPVV